MTDDAAESKTELPFYEPILTPGNRVRVKGPGYPSEGLVGTFLGETDDKRLKFRFDGDRGMIRVADFKGFTFEDAAPNTQMQFLNAVANDPRIIGDVGATLPLKVGDVVRVKLTAVTSAPIRDEIGVVARVPDISNRQRFYGVTFDIPGYREPQAFTRADLERISDEDAKGITDATLVDIRLDNNPLYPATVVRTPEEQAKKELGANLPPKPSIGRVVHFILPTLEHRPALVTNIPDENEPWKVNLSVVMDIDDRDYNETYQTRNVPCDPHAELPLTWHYPERIE